MHVTVDQCGACFSKPQHRSVGLIGEEPDENTDQTVVPLEVAVARACFEDLSSHVSFRNLSTSLVAMEHANPILMLGR